MLTPRLATSLLATVGLAGAASAQINWTTQMQFAQSFTDPSLPGNTLGVTATGVYTFCVRAGIFNLTGAGPGQANHGLNNWTATATATGLQAGETLGVNPADSRIPPFTFGPATSFGGTLVGSARINNINCARDVAAGGAAPWLWDTNTSAPGPIPTQPPIPPPEFGVDSYTNVWRFAVTIGTLSGANISIAFTGAAGPIIQWSVFGSNPPTGPTMPGNVNFIGLTPNPVLHDYAPVQLTLTRVPSPPVAAVLGLACLLAARRRRDSTGPPAAYT